jgi:hypothetical protein
MHLCYWNFLLSGSDLLVLAPKLATRTTQINPSRKGLDSLTRLGSMSDRH